MRRLLAVALVALALVANIAPASAHSPRCDDKYPYFQYRTTIHQLLPGNVTTYRFWYYNASTGAVHYDVCFAWE